MRVSALSQRFRYALTKAGLDLNFHPQTQQRHSDPLGWDRPQGHLQRLGHSTIGITGDTYTHVASELDRQAAQKLDDLLGPIVGER